MAKDKEYFEVSFEVKGKWITQDWDPNITTSGDLINIAEDSTGVSLGQKIKMFFAKTLDNLLESDLEEAELGAPGIIKGRFKRKST